MLNRSDILILDTEANGKSNHSEVIEVAVIDTTGKVLFESLSQPRYGIHHKAREKHGISNEYLREMQAPRWPEVYAGLMPILKSATTILAWNEFFDRRLLKQTTCRHSLEWPDLPWRCAMQDYRRHIGIGEGKYSLTAAAEATGVQLEGRAHRALHDCRLVLGVMRATAQ